MPINVNTTPQQVGVTVGETQIDVSVGGGVGPTGNSGTVAVSAPITNAGTSTAANIGLSIGTGLAVSGGSLVVTYGTTSTSACRGDDARLTDAREWSAATVGQADAEAGTSTSRFAFTPQRVFQAIAAWWAGSAAKTKLDGIATGATANATDAQLRDRSTHTGTQLAATISDFATAAVAAAPPTTDASLLTSGTLPDARLSSNIARTSDVSSAVAAVVNAAPATLDTLNELAAALGNDANFATTVTNSLAAKAPLASPTFTGTVSGITNAMVGLGNVPNVDATARVNHTGTQAITTVDGLQTALDGKAAAVHTHVIADVTGLQTALDGKQASGSYAAAVHTHGISDVTGLQTALDGKAAASHTHTASAITDFTAAVVAAAPPTTDASLLTQGTLSASRLPSTTVAAGSYGSASSVATFTVDAAGRLTAAGSSSIAIAAGAVSGLAAIATSGSASDLSAGTVPTARLGSGTANSTTFLRGDGTWAADSRWGFLVPSAPTSIIASAANGSAIVSWTAATSASAITNYIVQFSSDSGSTWSAFSATASTSLSRAVTGLTNGVSYIFRVAAVSGIGQGDWSQASPAVTPSSTATVSALVVAGGGGGGCGAGGGGGGGGVVYSESITLQTGQPVAVTVGSGGSGSGSTSSPGGNGSNSSFAGITAFGGGGGGSQPSQNNGLAGGSGGGGGGGSGQNCTGGSGTVGQGNSGGNGSGSPNFYGAGGGGGAGAPGGNGTGSVTGSGGAGFSSSISGAAIAYGGGGGGGVYINSSNTPGVGGSGGGGAGSAAVSVAGASGTANTGGGGGGGARSTAGDINSSGGNGGSGVVIIRSQRPATATAGSPTVTSSSGVFIYTFTASGSITF